MTTLIINKMLLSPQYGALEKAWDACQVTLPELRRRMVELREQFPVEVIRR